ncbi:MAG TPA: response regulator transcription factor [Thermoanaerobaculia bacterium]|nr:response regulator transcription factor [Thermoanaerobaculia bacterium]
MSGLVDAMVNRMPHVVVLPIDFPGLGGLKGIRDMHRLSPATKIVVLSRVSNQDEELEVLRRGAKGYSGPVANDVLFKMVDKVADREVWAGRKSLGALLDEFCEAGQSDEPKPHPALTLANLQQLTPRERQILRLLSEGGSNKEMAKQLSVSVSTIKAHLTKIFRKLGQPDRVRLALAITGGRPLEDWKSSNQ